MLCLPALCICCWVLGKLRTIRFARAVVFFVFVFFVFFYWKHLPAATGNHADESVETELKQLWDVKQKQCDKKTKHRTAELGDPGSWGSSLPAYPGSQLISIEMDI